MTTTHTARSIQQTARLAGLLYILSMPFSVFGYFYVPGKLIVPGDAAATARNIQASEGLFRSGIVSWLIGQAIYLVLPLLLYRLLKPVSTMHALLMVTIILLAVPIGFVNELNHLAVLLLLSGGEHLNAFRADQLQAQVMFFLDLHTQGIALAQILWGLWLLPFGYLVFKSGFLPRILGVLLMIACVGHLLDALGFLLFQKLDMSLSAFTFVGEVFIAVWLLSKGVVVERWERRALE